MKLFKKLFSVITISFLICMVISSPAYAKSKGSKTSLPEGTITAGQYLVGSDIPAGEYLLTKTGSSIMGYYEVDSDATGAFTSIVTNDNFTARAYISVSAGEYLTLKYCTGIASVSAAAFDASSGYPAGEYLVGKDIAAGTYKVTPTGDALFGYYCVSSDSTGALTSIVTNDNIQGPSYVTVSDGQYLKISYAVIN